MECEYNALVGRYYDGELPSEPRRAFEQHLADCAPCSADLNQLQGISRMLRSARIADGSPEFVGRMQGLSHHLEEYRIVTFARRLSAVAAAILVAAIGYGLLNPRATTPHQQAGLAPWEQPSAILETDLSAAASSTDDSSAPTGEAQFASLLVEDLSGGHP
ncbi:MAG TPA: anti-sigma factor [Tepidisphaeraceae bacterium]|nr:anti-sigma factor [Tepidisphaeraceae bacterium]